MYLGTKKLLTYQCIWLPQLSETNSVSLNIFLLFLFALKDFNKLGKRDFGTRYWICKTCFLVSKTASTSVGLLWKLMIMLLKCLTNSTIIIGKN